MISDALIPRIARKHYLCETIRHAERVRTRPVEPNPDYRYPDEREATCARDIRPGDRYFEYPDEPYRAGRRYCRVCAQTVWGLPS